MLGLYDVNQFNVEETEHLEVKKKATKTILIYVVIVEARKINFSHINLYLGF